MEIKDNKLSPEMLNNVKDVIAGAFKFEKKNYERAKYIVERLREIYANEKYNFCCVVGETNSFGAYYSYYHDIFFRCFFEGKYIIIWSGK